MREENWLPREKPSAQGENQQQTQPTSDAGPESKPGHTGERRALSALRHPCFPKYSSPLAGQPCSSYVIAIAFCDLFFLDYV